MKISAGSNKTIEGKGFRKSSGDNTAKLKSLANYNLVVIDEADEVSEEDFDTLDSSIRTSRGQNIIVLVFNMPSKNHWIIRKWFDLEETNIEEFYNPKPKNRDDTTYITGTYRDNLKNIPPPVRNLYEGYKETNQDYYNSMIRGLVSGGKRGRIFKNTKTISESDYGLLPYHTFYGLDFGFSSDPVALVEVKKHNNKLFLREVVYEPGLLNLELFRKANPLVRDGAMVYADSAEPKSIKELQALGWNVQGAKKTSDSVDFGIKELQGHEIYITENSKNIQHEAEEYVWALDRDKNPTDTPVDAHNHAWDAVRYAILGHWGVTQSTVGRTQKTSKTKVRKY
jgi:phage terminase large subunit